jgi:transcription elongation factor Elf1
MRSTDQKTYLEKIYECGTCNQAITYLTLEDNKKNKDYWLVGECIISCKFDIFVSYINFICISPYAK